MAPARALLAAGLALTLAACGTGPDWHATRLPPDFPDLRFRLTGDSGETLRARAFDGRLVLLTFGYTSCPDVCPATLARLRAALAELPETVTERYRVLFVSVDPGRDTPLRLARYTGAFGDAFTGATADEDRLRALAHRYGASFSHGEPDAGGFYPVSHPSGVFVFDGNGRARLLIDPESPVAELVADLRRLARGAA